MRKIPDVIKETWRKLRQNMTGSEKILWKELRDRKLWWKKFLRQYPIYLYTENKWFDRYIIPDFLCKEEKVIIELDWSIHDIKEVYLLDREKEKILLNIWYKIIRFKNEDICKNLKVCLNLILSSLS